MVQSDGWELTLSYRNNQGVLRVKPGFVAEAAGSAIVFHVDTCFPELPKQQPVELLVTFTTSYDGWGKVRTVVSVADLTDAKHLHIRNSADSGKYAV